MPYSGTEAPLWTAWRIWMSPLKGNQIVSEIDSWGWQSVEGEQSIGENDNNPGELWD